uniref:D-aminoacyl-tRNA deacylase n=1 Tax=Terrapene triunguis TaxID=2587831 RepID=A0A674J8M5_9SAUR
MSRGHASSLPCSVSLHRVRKILNLRVFEDESGKHWSKSVMDKQYEVLCVSQFTLQCILKGNKPDYHMAMPAEQAESFYNNFLEQLKKAYKPELIKGKVDPGCLKKGYLKNAVGDFCLSHLG